MESICMHCLNPIETATEDYVVPNRHTRPLFKDGQTVTEWLYAHVPCYEFQHGTSVLR